MLRRALWYSTNQSCWNSSLGLYVWWWIWGSALPITNQPPLLFNSTFVSFLFLFFSRTFSEKAHNFERTHHVESSDSLKRWKKRIPCKQGKHVVMLWAILKITCVLELYVKSLKEGRNYGFDPSLRKLSNKTSLACRVLEHVLKVGWNF